MKKMFGMDREWWEWEAWKWLGAGFIVLAGAFYRAFVAQCFWNWFAVAAFHVPSLGFLQMLGVVLLVHLLLPDFSKPDYPLLKKMFCVMELCVPADKQEDLAGLKGAVPLVEVVEGISEIGGKLFAITCMLALGFALHVLIARNIPNASMPDTAAPVVAPNTPIIKNAGKTPDLSGLLQRAKQATEDKR